MNVTVCELHHDERLEGDWAALVDHTREHRSELVLLPEMPFSDWLAASREVDPAKWREAIAAHERWWPRLAELGAPTVFTTRPIEEEGRFYNEGVVWQDGVIRPVHRKYYLPDEAGYWEATWYQRGAGDFVPVSAGDVEAGFLICTEIWFGEKARAYGKGGTNMLLTPRCTQAGSRERWLVAGRMAALVSGCYSLSSNHTGPAVATGRYAGQGWIIDPDGQVLGMTSVEAPCLTLDIDLTAAAAAKFTYPRYVIE